MQTFITQKPCKYSLNHSGFTVAPSYTGNNISLGYKMGNEDHLMLNNVRFVKDNSYRPERIHDPYILEAFIPEQCLLADNTDNNDNGLHLSRRDELRHAVGGVAAHTLRYYSINKEGFNVFRARGQAVWWLRHIYNNFNWWRAYVVNAEGERKDMPMLYVGEHFGSATSYAGREADIAISAFENHRGLIDPDDTAGTIFAVGYSERGGLFNSPDKYAAKTIVGEKYAGSGVNVNHSIHENLILMAKKILKNESRRIDQQAIQEEIKKLKVVILNRQRHKSLIKAIKEIGAQIILVEDDDLSPTFAVARNEIDLIIGVGGVPEGVLSAMLIEKLGGEMTLRLLPDDITSNEDVFTNHCNWDHFKMDEIEILKNFHMVKPGLENERDIPINKIFTSRDLAKGMDMVFTSSIIKETPWIKDLQGKAVPGVEIYPESGELVVHVIRVVDKNIEITPVIYKTAIGNYKRLLRKDLSIKEHANAHIQLALAYAEFGLFELAKNSIEKAKYDKGIDEECFNRYKVFSEYFKGLEILTRKKTQSPEEAIDQFEKTYRLDKDNKEGLEPKRMIKRIYEYMGDTDCLRQEYKNAIVKYKKALRYGPHELKLYRKINMAAMKPLLTKYFNNVNNEYYKNSLANGHEGVKFKLMTALEVYYEEPVYPQLAGDPWLIFFRRTVMHNMKPSYKLAVLIKLNILLDKINDANDSELITFLNNEFSVDKETGEAILSYRKEKKRLCSVSELYHIKGISSDVLVNLLMPKVKVESYNELESADVPVSRSVREVSEQRCKNILEELKGNPTKEVQELLYGVAESHHYTGLALYDVGDYAGARIYYGKAIKMFRRIIEKCKGITPVNAQYRIGNMFEEMALLFEKRQDYYYTRAKNEYLKISDPEITIKNFGHALNEVRINQAAKKVMKLDKIMSNLAAKAK